MTNTDTLAFYGVTFDRQQIIDWLAEHFTERTDLREYLRFSKPGGPADLTDGALIELLDAYTTPVRLILDWETSNRLYGNLHPTGLYLHPHAHHYACGHDDTCGWADRREPCQAYEHTSPTDLCGTCELDAYRQANPR